MPASPDRQDVPSELTSLPEITASRRNILKTATGLVAAAAVGGRLLASSGEVAAEEGIDPAAEQEAADLVAATGPNYTNVKFDTFATNFQALSFAFGMSLPVSMGGGGTTTNQPSISEITITKRMDKYTPKLERALVQGIPFAEVTIRVLRDSQLVATYLLEDVYVTGSSQAFAGTDVLANMIESVSLFFTRFTFTFGTEMVAYDQHPPTT